MSAAPTQIILGSRSPRRAELLRLVIVADCVRVLPPASSEELGFDGLHNWAVIEYHLSEVTRNKCDDVLKQLDQSSPDDRDQFAAVVTADTIIVADDGDGRLVVLGQPPETGSWRDVVRGWFHRYYLGKTHTAATAFCVATPTGQIIEMVVTTRVTFRPDDSETRLLVEWYLDTGEPRGKAGGYALQGAGGLFVSAVEGSISNVVGLPLRELLNAFIELNIDVTAIDH